MVAATTTPVRVTAFSFQMDCTPATCSAGTFYLQIYSTSDMQQFTSAAYQMTPVAFFNSVTSGVATITFNLGSGWELGMGWTGYFSVTTSIGMIVNWRNLNAPVAPGPICFTPSLTSPVQFSLTVQRGGPLSYTSTMSGTSTSTAAIAGAAAVVRQYYAGGFYPTGIADPANVFTPSAALIKATLINSATPIAAAAIGSFFGPSAAIAASAVIGQGGFGVPSLPRGLTLPNSGQRLLVLGLSNSTVGRADPFLTVTGSSATYCVNVPAPPAGPTMPLVFTLVWRDPAAVAAAANPLIINLDLAVSPPGSAFVIFGNSNVTSPVQVPDTINNVERLSFPRPLAGVYTVRVLMTSNGMAATIPTAAFSLVAAGPGISTIAADANGRCSGAAPAAAPTVSLESYVGTAAGLGVTALLAVVCSVVLFIRVRKVGSSSSSSSATATKTGTVSSPNPLAVASVNGDPSAVELAAPKTPGSAVQEWAGQPR